MNKTQNKGITLIALVITIIVMLILVGVTISMSLNGGLFGYAKQAKEETEKAKQDEINLSGGTINGQTIDEIVDVPMKSYEEAKKVNGLLTENATYKSGKYTAVIPKGFTVSNVTEEQTIEEGLVITDNLDEKGNNKGNEFVWVPVNTEDFSLLETLPKKVANSIKKCNGFYIGRYEASATNSDSYEGRLGERALELKNSGPDISFDGSSVVSAIENMYTNKSNYGAITTMPYDCMWDLTVNFIEDGGFDVTDSTSWGNFSDTKNNYPGASFNNYFYSELDSCYYYGYNSDAAGGVITSGKYERSKANNIYDLAGNVWEFTIDPKDRTGYSLRGGAYSSGTDSVLARMSSGAATWGSHFVGFRVALYVEI